MPVTAIEEGIKAWASDIRVLLDACRQIVEFYGTDDELDSFQTAARAPLSFVSALEAIASGRDVDTTKAPAFSKFVCGEALAEMLSPLLRIVVEWQPDFVADAFDTLDDARHRKVTVPYGQFLGTVGKYVCGPAWSAFPRLAPPGWPT
jgi:hypothetical protein